MANVQIHVSSLRNKPKPKKKYRARHRRMRKGQCVAVLRATTAAQIYLDGKTSSLAAAALRCGSCRTYVQAALILLRSENVTMLERVLHGHLPLQAAAKQVKQIADLVAAYRTASAADRAAFAKAIGPTLAEHIARSSPAERIAAARAVGVDLVWDTMVAPVIATERTAAE